MRPRCLKASHYNLCHSLRNFGDDFLFDRRTIALAEAISCSIAGRSLWRRRFLVRSTDDRSGGGDFLFDRRTIALAEAISYSIARRSLWRRRFLVRSPDDRSGGRDFLFDRRTIDI